MTPQIIITTISLLLLNAMLIAAAVKSGYHVRRIALVIALVEFVIFGINIDTKDETWTTWYSFGFASAIMASIYILLLVRALDSEDLEDDDADLGRHMDETKW